MGKITENLPVRLTDAELASKAFELGRAIVEVKTIKDNLKDHLADEKARIKSKQDEIEKLAGILKERQEMRDIDCIEQYDHETATVHIMRTDTNEIIRVRPMTESDRQLTLYREAKIVNAEETAERFVGLDPAAFKFTEIESVETETPKDVYTTAKLESESEIRMQGIDGITKGDLEKWQGQSAEEFQGRCHGEYETGEHKGRRCVNSSEEGSFYCALHIPNAEKDLSGSTDYDDLPKPEFGGSEAPADWTKPIFSSDGVKDPKPGPDPEPKLKPRRSRKANSEQCSATMQNGRPCKMPARENGLCYIHNGVLKNEVKKTMEVETLQDKNDEKEKDSNEEITPPTEPGEDYPTEPEPGEDEESDRDPDPGE